MSMRPITSDMSEEDRRPYFLWDEDLSISELRVRLIEGPESEKLRLLGKMLREARDIDVWLFVTPAMVAEHLPKIARRVGRRHRFWQFLINGWRADGLLDA